MSDSEKKGDILHVLGKLDEKNVLMARERQEGIEVGVGQMVRSAADLLPGMEYAKREDDGSYRVQGRIPGGGCVANESFRTGWDNVWGKGEVGQA
jgi:hypothetical protein